MGTSNSFGGPNNGTPLIPTWLDPDAPIMPLPPSVVQPDGSEKPAIAPEVPIRLPAIRPAPNRFTTARTARRHIAAIGQAESLLPFESAMLAMLLEQSKEITVLQQKLEELMAKNG